MFPEPHKIIIQSIKKYKQSAASSMKDLFGFVVFLFFAKTVLWMTAVLPRFLESAR